MFVSTLQIKMGKGVLAAKDGSGKSTYEFRSLGHTGTDGKTYGTGMQFGPIPTGSLSFLYNTIALYKDKYDKSGNGKVTTWTWKG